ncbi:basic proline-rich protein-like isoform X1 [Rissa tridactyla]|uniref:basic proline-rich protein-like isoform X1 n=1 Tax=Rissa tridactyla TaxID=75485 RepID=UPI0023BA57C3|nr:basic proline-rich protein-like isoform X1 [Rissa tridactyla]XP_054036969.1 basic proline-rich protein-like isoform X1 [Rissa tridactyla]
MFSPLGCRRGFPRETGPWQAGPPPRRARGPQIAWHKPPWEQQQRRGRGRWHPPGPWAPRPFHGPAKFHGNEEDRRWASHDCPPPPAWDDREDNRGPEDFFKEDWDPPGPWYCGPVPGPDDFPWSEEDRRWAPHDCPPPPPWYDREDNQGPEDYFEEDWHPEPPLPGPDCFAWPEFPEEEQHPPCPPASLPGEQGGFQDGFPSRPYRGLGRKRRRLRHGHRELTFVQRLPCPRPSRGNQPSSRSSPSLSGTSCPGVKEEPQPPDPPRPLISCKDGAQSSEQMAQVDPPVERGKVPEPPGPADTPQKSLDTDPGAVMEVAEPEQASGETPVEPGSKQKPAGSHGQSPSALETEPALPEESSAGTEEHLEVGPCSPSVPKAGAGGGSRPHTPTAPPEPAEMVCTAAGGSAGEVGAELCLCSWRRQCLPSGTGEAEAEDAGDGLLGAFHPSKNSQVLLGATVEPDTRPRQPGSDVCTPPETSPGTQHPPGSGETEPAAGGRHRLCSALLTSSPARAHLRSAAVLARKEEIELSYQQFSLTIAVVATMLLQKEPSMEASLGLALRANLRQGRIHHLRELEDFINSYDSATLSR